MTHKIFSILIIVVIWSLQDFQAVANPVSNPESDLSSAIQFKRAKDSILPRQEENEIYEADDSTGDSDNPRIRDFLKGLSSILNGIITLDIKNVLGGTFQFIPPSVRAGVESIVGAVIGAPRATTIRSVFVNRTSTTSGDYGLNSTGTPSPAENDDEEEVE